MVIVISRERTEASQEAREVSTSIQEPETFASCLFWHFPQASEACFQDPDKTRTLPILFQRTLTYPEFCNYTNLKRRDFNVSIYVSIILNYAWENKHNNLGL